MPKRSIDGSSKICIKLNPLDTLSNAGTIAPTPTMHAYMIEFVHIS